MASAKMSLGMVVIVATVCLVGWSAQAGQKPDWRSGVGTSELVDPAAAGDEAARLAKAELEGAAAKFVVVVAAEPQVTPELVAGVTKHFDAAIVYGCQVASPLTMDTNFPDASTLDIEAGVAVWALGGDVDITTVVVETDPDDDDAYYTAGSELGARLKDAMEANTRPGNLILTFGDQYNGSNKDLAAGFNDGLENYYPIIGAAAGNITAKVIVQGEIKTGVNVATLLAGDYRLGMAMNGGTHTPETADKTLREAMLVAEGDDPFFAFVFNCRRRRQGMIERNQLGEELAVIKNRLPGLDFFGYYGPGEIGTKEFGKPSEGVGFTVVTAVFFPVKEAE